ncbi:MAG: hypothetical protein FGM22_07345 [Burkholderiaceae bacterium]|nr:hypothetical protein [Burkholderiaceae bacterium]
MLDLLKRYGTLTLCVGILAGAILQPDLWNTIHIATVATLQSVVLADFVQWIYTKLRWTDLEANAQPREINEIVAAAKLRVLGSIYVGVAVLVGLTYYAVYYVQRIPGIGQ